MKKYLNEIILFRTQREITECRNFGEIPRPCQQLNLSLN